MAASTTSTASAVDWDPGEWELINDDGFVYKRKKRRPDLSSLARPPDPVPDPELEERQRRERKRRALLKVRDKYAREISLWEHLSNTLRASEESAMEKREGDRVRRVNEKQKLLRRVEAEAAHSDGSEREASRSLVDGLLLKVEAQEAIIGQLTNLCDIAEALCNAQEEKVMQSLLDLQIWGSPRELVASLCKD